MSPSHDKHKSPAESLHRNMASSEQDLPAFHGSTTYGSSVSTLSRKFPKLRTTSKKKCVYNIRLLKSRGALLVLVWNLLIFSYQATALSTIVDLLIVPRVSKTYPWIFVLATILLQECLPNLIYPVAGWIADARVGRYKVIRASLWIMWIGSLLLAIEKAISYILTYAEDEPMKPPVILNIFVVVVYVINSVGIAGFQANLIPFGVDQMEDGSSDEYSAFIHWYYWTRNSSLGFIIQIAIQSANDYCETEDTRRQYQTEPRERYDMFILLLQVSFVTVALCLDFLFSDRVLNKDPKTHNPLKKIFNISMFVAKNNRLVGYRKAITYTYDTPIQRTDFAKQLYGGPFEGDDVEDVKTFWKILVFLLSLGFGGTFILQASYFTFRSYVDHMNQTSISSLSFCTTRHIISELTYPLVITAIIPFYEFFVYPFFRKWVPRIMKRIALGMTIMTLAVVGMLVLDSVGHAQTEGAACMLDRTPSDAVTLVPIGIKMEYFLPFVILIGFGEVLTFIPAFEFIIAQSPYSMRGLMIGLFYAIYGLFTGLTGILVLVVAKASGPITVKGGLSCGSWFYLVTAVVGIVGIVLYIVSCAWYKKRQRGGEYMVNHQAVIESYFETSDNASDS